MSGSGSTTTQTQGPPEWLQNYGRDYLGMAGQIAQTPYTPYGGQRVADLTGAQTRGIDFLDSLIGGNSNLGNSQAMLDETLSGGGMNPYLGGMSDRIVGDAGRAYGQATGATTARFNRPGSWGSSAHMGEQDRVDQNFSRGMGDALSQLYAGGYENERNRQMQAVGASTGLYDTLGRGANNAITAGNVDRSYMQDLLNSAYSDFTDWRNYPTQQLDIFGNALGRAMGSGGQTSTTQGPPPDRVSQGIGTLAIGNMLASGKKG